MAQKFRGRAYFLHQGCCNELLLVQKKCCAFDRAKKNFEKPFQCVPRGNACASMPSSQLKFFCCCSSFSCPISPI